MGGLRFIGIMGDLEGVKDVMGGRMPPLHGGSEGEVEGEAEAGTGDGVGGMAVGDAPDVVEAEAAEDVVEAGGEFDVGGAADVDSGDAVAAVAPGIGGEGEHIGIEARIVPVGEFSPE